MPFLSNGYEQLDFGIEKRADMREAVVGLGYLLIRLTRIKKRCALDRVYIQSPGDSAGLQIASLNLNVCS